MILEDKLELRGHLQIFDANTGELLRDVDNMIVTTGKNLVRDLLSGADTTNYLHSFAVGTGTTAPASTDTGLQTPILYDGANTYKTFQEYDSSVNAQTVYVGFLSATEANTNDITELGLFTGSATTAGTMYCRATFTAITKTSATELRVEYRIKT